MENEVWLPVLKLYSYNSDWSRDKEYLFNHGEYFVSNLGRFKKKDKIMKGSIDYKGYTVVSLKRKRFKLHQVVMQVFHPSGYFPGSSVDHINRNNKQDNSVFNLRWASKEIQFMNRENCRYKTKNVLCLNNNTVYDSCASAEEKLGLVKNTVSRVARGERASIHNYKFIFVE